MTEVPRRAASTEPERLRRALAASRAKSADGGTEAARVVQKPNPANLAPGVEPIVNGDDPDTPRSSAAIVLWMGAAAPVNAMWFDLRYPANPPTDWFS